MSSSFEKPSALKKGKRSKTNLPLRFIIFHIHTTSARLRFLCQASHSSASFTCSFPLQFPTLSELIDEHRIRSSVTAVHPSAYAAQLCEQLAISPKTVEIVGDFRTWIETPRGDMPIFLLQVKGEQPFAAPEGCRWIEFPDSFSLLPIEREVLLKVYRWLLG